MYDYQISSNNITYNAGDSILIDFTNTFLYIKSIDAVSFDFTPLDTAENCHDIYVRWSYDVNLLDRATGKPHVVWSGWILIAQNGKQIPEAQSILNKMIRSESDSFDLQFKLVRRGLQSGARSINRIIINYTAGEIPENAEEVPVKQSACKANACPTTNFSSGITIGCDKNLFRPYDVINPAIKIYHEMACAISEMFGHCVRYFKTQAKLESADPILKEYSLYEVTAVKDIKILLPDNTIPDNAINFGPYDMDFGEGLEVHIVREHFERAFGYDDLPEQKDYIYFPLLDRIFEVHSAYLFRDFMANEVYYKVMLYKWQDKLNVMRENPEIDKYVNDIHVSLDEVFDGEIQREYDEITKPMQYQTIAIGGYDSVRSHINEKLVIETKDLSNYFTVVGKYFYDMTKNMTQNDIAVKYKAEVNRTSSENTAFSAWFKPQHLSTSTNTSDIIFDAYSDTESKGLRVSFNYQSNTSEIKSVTVKINSQTLTFATNFPTLNNQNWYAIVVNNMNEFSQTSVHIWEMKYKPNQQGSQNTTDLRLIFTELKDSAAEDINPTNTVYQLRAGTTYITNIRVWKDVLEEEKQPIVLNQYVVKDSDLAILIDNAISPLRLVKEYVR